MTDDRPTDVPSPANDTEIPPAPETIPEIVIPMGEAELHLSAALDVLVSAILRVEAVSMAVARQLDQAAAAPEVPS